MSDQTPVFLLALLKIDDMTGFQADYVGPLQAINARHKVETVVATPKLEPLEGETGANAAAILRFPSRAALDAWYADPDYQRLIAVRQAASDTSASHLIALTPVN